MAEGFFRHYFGNAGDNESAAAVRSAGLEPHRVNLRAIKAMAELGIDISGHTSNHLKEYLGEEFDYVITVCDNAAANCPTFPGEGTRIHWPFDDPATGSGSDDEIMAEFRRVRDEIGARIISWLDEVTQSR